MVAESFKFNKRDQKQNESLTEYIVELKSIAQNCDFGDFLNRALRDKFICGINNEAIQQKLFNDASLKTFEKACETALMMEMTRQNLEIIHSGSGHSGSVNNVASHKHHQKQRSNSGQQSQQPQSSSNSQRSTCYSCGSKGHIARFCYHRQRQNRPQTK